MRFKLVTTYGIRGYGLVTTYGLRLRPTVYGYGLRGRDEFTEKLEFE